MQKDRSTFPTCTSGKAIELAVTWCTRHATRTGEARRGWRCSWCSIKRCASKLSPPLLPFFSLFFRPRPTPRYGAVAGVLNGEWFVAGGHPGDDRLFPSAIQLSAVARKWEHNTTSSNIQIDIDIISGCRCKCCWSSCLGCARERGRGHSR